MLVDNNSITCLIPLFHKIIFDVKSKNGRDNMLRLKKLMICSTNATLVSFSIFSVSVNCNKDSGTNPKRSSTFFFDVSILSSLIIFIKGSFSVRGIPLVKVNCPFLTVLKYFGIFPSNTFFSSESVLQKRSITRIIPSFAN